MILYYANGGGLGHITRTSAMIHQLDIPKNEILLLTASHFAKTPFISPEIKIEIIPNHLGKNIKDYQRWLLGLFEKYNFHRIYLDAFPLGIQGEFENPELLNHISKAETFYIARILQWDKYIQSVSNIPIFKKTYILEELGDNHLDWIQTHSLQTEYLVLQYPKIALGDELKKRLLQLKNSGKQIWLIVHSEPKAELNELYGYAFKMSELEHKNPHFILVSQENPSIDSVEWIPIYPAYPLYGYADKIFTACGFNAMQEVKAYSDKHHYMPFERRFDNQFLRASQNRKSIL